MIFGQKHHQSTIVNYFISPLAIYEIKSDVTKLHITNTHLKHYQLVIPEECDCISIIP